MTPAAMDAMKKYQDKSGLSSTGKIDAVSPNKLGLGSDTAGKGAPVPAASSSASPADPPREIDQLPVVGQFLNA